MDDKHLLPIGSIDSISAAILIKKLTPALMLVFKNKTPEIRILSSTIISEGMLGVTPRRGRFMLESLDLYK
jgi:hypothetical protein